jgi:High-affinity nickel-transport protein
MADVPGRVVFGIGFDTATEVPLLTTTAFLASEHIPWQAIIALPILFTAGMSLMDTSDSMSHRNLVDAFLVRIPWRLAEAQVSQEIGQHGLFESPAAQITAAITRLQAIAPGRRAQSHSSEERTRSGPRGTHPPGATAGLPGTAQR